MNVINIAVDYTPFPGGRYPTDGKGNGTTFRQRFLVPILKSGGHAEVILDGAMGYPSSFLEEAFGGLVRSEGFEPEVVLKSFSFTARQPGFARFVEMIQSYVKSANVSHEVRN